MDLFTQDIHPAVELAFKVWAYLGGIWLVWWIIMKLTKANQIIENAKNLPGGMNYQTPEEFAEENEELGYRAHG